MSVHSTIHIVNRFLCTAAVLFCVIVFGCAFGSQGSSVQPVKFQPSPHSYEGLKNVRRVTGKLWSGSEPEGDTGFDSLLQLGVKTIISVDGHRPDLRRAAERGLRYVHIPVGYDAITSKEQFQLAKAVHDLPGKAYIHCHHGKHRGPAAAVLIAVALGNMGNTDAVAFMQSAGTSADYPGLYACVRRAMPLADEALESASLELPESVQVSGVVWAMAEMDRAFDHLEIIRDAGWDTPPRHPDLAAEREATQIAALLQALGRDPETAQRPRMFFDLLGSAQRSAVLLKEGLSSGYTAPGDLSRRLLSLDQSCAACHTRYRN